MKRKHQQPQTQKYVKGLQQTCNGEEEVMHTTQEDGEQMAKNSSSIPWGQLQQEQQMKKESSTESRHDKNAQRCEKDEETEAFIEERKIIKDDKERWKDVSKKIKRCTRDKKKEQRDGRRHLKYWKNSKEPRAFRASHQRGRQHSFQKYVTKRMKSSHPEKALPMSSGNSRANYTLMSSRTRMNALTVR